MKKKISNRGETLLEVVLSVALFSITMLMLATMFLGAMKTAQENYDTEVVFDNLLNAAVKKENTEELRTREIEFTLDDSRKITQKVKTLKTALPDTGFFYQFEISN